MAAMPGWLSDAKNFGLTLKPCQPLRVGRERFGENLERHLTLELRVGGLIDLAHPALADEGGDVVMGDAVTYGEGHRESLWMRLRLTLAQELPPLGIRANLSDMLEPTERRPVPLVIP